jgi:predicted kinase
VVLARNAARPRPVDEEVVRRQLERVEQTTADGVLTSEGCNAVWILREPDAPEGVTVARLPAVGEPGLSPNPPPRPR